MSDRTRYQAQSLYQETSNVSSYRGVDPVTGLPVLIYRFQGKPDPALARLDSEYLPRLLAWRDDDVGGVMVVSWSSALVPAGNQPLDNLQLLDAARALADAAAAGVTHGDLTPSRFLLAGDSVVLEGFGVPWHTGRPEPGEDVRAWARSVRQLGHSQNPSLGALLAELEAAPEATAEQLLSRLKDILLRGEVTAAATPLANASAPVPEVVAEPEAVAAEEADADASGPDTSGLDLGWDSFAGPEDSDLDFGSANSNPGLEALDIELEYDPAQVSQPQPAPQAPVAEEVESVEAGLAAEVNDAGTEPDSAVFRPSSAFASERLKPAATAQREPAQPPAGGSSSYLKRLEDREPAPGPGPSRETGRGSGQHEWDSGPGLPPERNSRRIIMFTALLILSAVLIALVVYLRNQERERVPEPLSQPIIYIIDVLVEPTNLPPVDLFVLESPEAAGLRPNTKLGTAPRSMGLDAEGTWIFEGRFQGRISAPVTVRVPQDRSTAVTIVIPPEEPAEE